MPTSDTDTELLIIGAGPTGLFASFYAGLRGLSVTLLDSLPHLGGQVAALYPRKEIFDIAGFPAVTGQELVDRLVAQARLAEPVIRLDEAAGRLESGPDAVTVTTSSGRRIRAGAVLITAGIGHFTPRPLPALDTFAGSGVHHVVAEAETYTGRHVVIVGGGDSAVDWANALVPYARQVTLVHRRKRFRAHEQSVTRLMDSTVRILTDSEIAEVHGGDRMEAVTVRDCGSQALLRLDADVLIPALGHIASLGPLTGWGLHLRGQQIEVATDMSTGVDRVFAAGDITTYPGKVRLMAVGFGEAATAVNNLAVRLRPGEDLFPGHSTDRPTAPPPQKEVTAWPM
ncbi:NAD(P)/FAD-dependent oxidoreductase [Streptomyces sp. NBC_00988]|uniref:NAD(P)/FAD-dependent oxidoreductase n=1 Tax=Streptomyces sp. NBC_00988 TaxID=2903704 RepID=UPI0038698A38|nr:NAD(P)/FAD-dependent oxidoreductase [Streptomyces sp. NBC_00988]